MSELNQDLRRAALAGPPVDRLWRIYRRHLGPAATPTGLAEALRRAGIDHPDLARWLARQYARCAPTLRRRLLETSVGQGATPPAHLPGGQARDDHGLYRDERVIVALRRQGRGERATWYVNAGLLLAGHVPILRSDAVAQAVEIILGDRL